MFQRAAYESSCHYGRVLAETFSETQERPGYVCCRRRCCDAVSAHVLGPAVPACLRNQQDNCSGAVSFLMRHCMGVWDAPQAGQLCWLTDTTPHESLPLHPPANDQNAKRVYRQFFRLVVGPVSTWWVVAVQWAVQGQYSGQYLGSCIGQYRGQYKSTCILWCTGYCNGLCVPFGHSRWCCAAGGIVKVFLPCCALHASMESSAGLVSNNTGKMWCWVGAPTNQTTSSNTFTVPLIPTSTHTGLHTVPQFPSTATQVRAAQHTQPPRCAA